MLISTIFSVAIYNISFNEIDRGLSRQTITIRGLPLNDFFNQGLQNLENMRADQLRESKSHLITNLVYFNILILILSSVTSYFWARKTMKPIEEAMLAQNPFTADASHELRTPLTAMKSEIEVNLRDKKLNLNTAKKLLASNLEEISKLESLSNALLKLARYEERPKTQFSKISLSDVVAEAYEKLEKIATHKSIKFKNNLQNIYVIGDRESLVELFIIFIDNAIKYSPKSAIVNIDIVKEGSWVIIKIKDRGIGIKSSDLPYIFNRFYRADSSRSKEKIQGYGLGLSIAKQIVDLHNGTIGVFSKPGKGTEFRIKIPIKNT
ncbi:MAG: HAMP domain-containing histidine kinase [Patescibacteria group bacterium]|nr:HAMP domain-containing histidine kinase [Patescibacteria group bacterium]